MKLYLLILFSVFSIESALASPDWCLKIFPKIGNFLTVSKLTSSSPLKREKAITDTLTTYEPEVAESLLLQAVLKTQKKQDFLETDNARKSLFRALKNVAGIKTQLVLIDLFDSANPFVKQEIVEVLSSLESSSSELFEFMIRVLEEESSFSSAVLAVEFFKNKKEDTVVEFYKKLLLIEKKISYFESIQQDIIFQIIDTLKPEVAESLFLESLPKVQNFQYKEQLIYALVHVAGEKTQIAFAELLESKSIQIFFKNTIITASEHLENPSPELLQAVTQILEDESNIHSTRINALRFFRNKKGKPVFEIYKKLLMLENKISITLRQEIIAQILKTQEAEVAESLFLQVLPETQVPQIQKSLIEAVATVAGIKTQSVFIDLLQNPDTRLLIKITVILALKNLENSPKEVVEALDQIPKDDLALQFIEDIEEATSQL